MAQSMLLVRTGWTAALWETTLSLAEWSLFAFALCLEISAKRRQARGRRVGARGLLEAALLDRHPKSAWLIRIGYVAVEHHDN